MDLFKKQNFYIKYHLYYDMCLHIFLHLNATITIRDLSIYSYSNNIFKFISIKSFFSI